MNMDDVVEQAKAAIDLVFSDTTVDPDVTRDRLEDIQDHIDVCLNALDADAAAAVKGAWLNDQEP